MPDLNQIEVFNIILGLDKNLIDIEFINMLAIMDEIGDFYFEYYQQGKLIRELIKYLKNKENNILQGFKKDSLETKGQMGEYFMIYLNGKNT